MRWLIRFLPSPTPRSHDHVSVWSVSARDARTFFRVVGALWLAGIGFSVHRELDRWPSGSGGSVITEQSWRYIGDFTFAVLADFGTVGIAITIVAMLLTRTLNSTGELLMSLYQAMVNRFVLPVIEEHRAEGREQGRAQALAEWRAWNERRLAAEREGREFTEPPSKT